MKIVNSKIELEEKDLKEIFSLFSSCTEYEIEQIYNLNSINYFLKTNLNDEYILSEEKREYAIDSMRAVLFFLNKNNFKLTKNGVDVSLEFIISGRE